MARPRNADGQRTRQAILDAALDLFAQKGFFGTSLRDVATAVGVRESALYNYFPSKDALFEALLLADQHSKVERLTSLAEERDHRRPGLPRAARARGARELRGAAPAEVVPDHDVGRHPPGARRPHQPVRAAWRPPRAHGGHHASPDPRGLAARGRSAGARDVVRGPALHVPAPGRHRRRPAADSQSPRDFARQHVELFLRGASAAIARPKAAPPRGRQTNPAGGTPHAPHASTPMTIMTIPVARHRAVLSSSSCASRSLADACTRATGESAAPAEAAAVSVTAHHGGGAARHPLHPRERHAHRGGRRRRRRRDCRPHRRHPGRARHAA